jgi:chemotaxis protein MotA
MEPASLIGLVMIFFGVFVGGMMKGVNPAGLFAVPAAFLIVIVASIGAAMMGQTWADAKKILKYMMKGIKGDKPPDTSAAIDQIVKFAERARRDGLLALEEEVREVMEAEVQAMSDRHKIGQKFMTSIGIFAPTFGIIGAVFGLIATLSKLDDPSELGHGIAAAFVATFWGVFLANGLFLPIANKLQAMSGKEIAFKRLVIEGVLSIQAGANPRLLDDLLRSSLPPSERVSDDDRKSA